MNWFLYIVLIGAVAYFAFNIWRNAVKSETESSKVWYMERLPFSMKSIQNKQKSDKAGMNGRNKMAYDPEADYESLEQPIRPKAQ